MTASESSRRTSRAVTMFTVAVLVAGPPLNYLRYHHYPPFAPEVLVPLALWLVCAIGIGAALNRAARPVRIVAFTMLLLLWADWQFSDSVTLPFKLLVVSLLVAVWLLERHVETIAAVALAAFYVASLPTGSAVRSSSLQFASVPRDTSLPPVVYLILDEHIGVEGWPAEFASTRGMQSGIRQFYLDEGFRLFGKAYSEFPETYLSIPSVLNWPIEDPRQGVTEVAPEQRYVLRTNKLFERLSAEGYRIRVYQSTYMDFCDPRAYRIQSCETRPGNSIRNLSLHHLPLFPKARMVALYFLEYNSRLYARLRETYSAFAERRTGWPRWTARIRQSAFPAAMEELDRLQADLGADDPRGTVYFAHLLAPHHPYEVDAACRSQAHPSRWLEIMPYPDRGTDTPEGRALRYDLYAAQTGCLYRHLAAFFHTLDSLPAGRQAAVIVHGDHGSRIPLHYPEPSMVTQLVPSDLADGFSTLFALRGPQVKPGYDERFAPISELVGQALDSGAMRVTTLEAEAHTVRMTDGFHTPFVTLQLTDTSLALRSPAGTPVGRGAAAPATAQSIQERR